MKRFNLESIKISESPLKLIRFYADDSKAVFELIDRNRTHLSQDGDITAAKYQTIEDFMNSIIKPKDKFRLRMGIWNEETLVGSINITPKGDKRAEVGYWLGKEYTGKGYMTTSLSALTDYALSDGFDEVFAEVITENESSIRVLVRAGYSETTKKDSGKRVFSKRKAE
ncbi:GNAT family N-acetyltransferase [Candidatus Pacearchaeota archaeon]|nr:GNAT family N-acetyltransferase [Candidatus Pacearchaeota archaeon]